MNIDKGIALGQQASGVELVVFPQEEYTHYSKLSLIEKRKMLARSKPLSTMTYQQAKLFHRLRRRIG